MPRKTNEPRRCSCSAGADSLSTHRAARHDGTCPHSDLRRTTKRYQRIHARRLPGTRGLTVTVEER